jgi:hypothetical protein
MTHEDSLKENKGYGGRSKSLTILFLHFPYGCPTSRDARLWSKLDIKDRNSKALELITPTNDQ